jgi:hypothetical protein
LGGDQPSFVSRFPQDLGRARQMRETSSREGAGEGVVNDDGLAPGGYGFAPVVIV